jgi:3'(2'), 5'-bisphosphate nucleotidase
MNTLLNQIIKIAADAGKAIMEIYEQAPQVAMIKSDESPLTQADLASDLSIKAGLEALALGFPILSEESIQLPYQAREHWAKFWLIDPLDGTKEFIKRNGEFTVNIALIENGKPILGVVYAPAPQQLYYAAQGMGAWFRTNNSDAKQIHVQALKDSLHKVVLSRSHADEPTLLLLKKIGPHQAMRMGSSLKMCLVASGEANFYPRLGPTMEWDTAAAHAVVNEAGGIICDIKGEALTYNKADLHNPEFLVMPIVDKNIRLALFNA